MVHAAGARRSPRRESARRSGKRRVRPPGLPATALAAAVLLAAAPPAAVAQAADSAEIVDRLRDRQGDFERYRRLRLPPTGAVASGRCDEHVGRYCLFHDDEDGWEPGPADPEIRRRRRRLVERFARAARILPGDGWIAGQRVRYLVADGRPGAAAAAARGCRAEPWWCRALEAFALHHAGWSGAADSVFSDALHRMPEALRRRWIDPSVLLEDAAADRLATLQGGARRAWLERLWWLSDPLWSRPGRGRRSGHLARRVRGRLQRDADGPYGTAWGDDLAELTVRYGWPVGWERVRPGHYGLGADPTVVAHHDPSARVMVPPPRVLEDPFVAGPETWPIEPEEPRSEYASPRLDTLARPAVRTSRFSRPDSLHLVATWRWEEGAGGRAVLAAEAGPGGPSAASSGRPEGTVGSLTVAVPARPVVASLELVGREGRRAARHRVGIRPPERPEGVPGLSDLLPTSPGSAGAGPAPADTTGETIFRRGEATPRDLSAAAERARPPRAARPGERVGLYWEAYGRAGAMEGGRTEVRLVQAGGGFLEGLARGLGLADEPREVAIEWSTAPAGDGRVHPAGVVLALPGNLEPGRYAVEVTVRPPGRDLISTRTVLRVVEPDEAGAD